MRVPLPLSLLLLVSACAKKEPPPPPVAAIPVALSVQAVTLGKALGADKKVLEATETFASKDAIYASVETDGAADRARLEAKWTFLGARGPVPVGENALELVGLAGPSRHEFHITRTSAWQKGAYQVEILLNGASVVKKGFTVQ